MTSSTNKDGLDSELESFRQQWLSDLKTKNDHHNHDHAHEQLDAHTLAAAGQSSTRRRPSQSGPPHSFTPSGKKLHAVEDEEDDWLPAQSFDGPSSSPSEVSGKGKGVQKELVSALDHYEEAMEKEAQGNMGDSLKHYRKAYRLDNRVDRTYREKHFPSTKPSKPAASHQRSPSSTTITTTTTSTAAPTTTLTSALQNPPAGSVPPPQLPIADLIASFSHLKLQPAAPEIEGTPPPPCPIAVVPDEILIHIMRDVAIDDVADFVRLAQVCKHFAFLVTTEQRIYRRVALGEEIGFAAMHYHWQTGVSWEPLEDEPDEIADGVIVTAEQLAQRRRDHALAVTQSLTPSVYPSWHALLRSRPRIRFNGCYICTVNYVRTGQASTNQSTWNSPIHIVTYYRYLRFFRDGGVISLLTTLEPADVVHHLTRADLLLHRGGAHAHLPSAVMAQALKGRWRLGSDDGDGGGGASDAGGQGPAEQQQQQQHEEEEGDVFIETEGVAKYMYRIDLGLRSAGKGARNNKLVWKGFYSYNKLTEDWAEFRLKNDKPFYFSRVKSYGAGE